MLPSVGGLPAKEFCELIAEVCDIGRGYPKTVGLAVFPKYLHGGFEILRVLRVEFACQLLTDLAARLRLISGDRVN